MWYRNELLFDKIHLFAKWIMCNLLHKTQNEHKISINLGGSSSMIKGVGVRLMCTTPSNMWRVVQRVQTKQHSRVADHWDSILVPWNVQSPALKPTSTIYYWNLSGSSLLYRSPYSFSTSTTNHYSSFGRLPIQPSVNRRICKLISIM